MDPADLVQQEVSHHIIYWLSMQHRHLRRLTRISDYTALQHLLYEERAFRSENSLPEIKQMPTLSKKG